MSPNTSKIVLLISFTLLTSPFSVHVKLVPISSSRCARERGHPGKVSSPSQGHISPISIVQSHSIQFMSVGFCLGVCMCLHTPYSLGGSSSAASAVVVKKVKEKTHCGLIIRQSEFSLYKCLCNHGWPVCPNLPVKWLIPDTTSSSYCLCLCHSSLSRKSLLRNLKVWPWFSQSMGRSLLT